MLLAACSGAPHSLGEQCSLNSDCAAPLACLLGKCRNACRATRDCPFGAQCRLDSAGLGSCVPPDELACQTTASCPANLACVASTCRNECAEVADCPVDATCAIASGLMVCFDLSEAPDAGRRSDAGIVDEGTVADATGIDATLTDASHRDAGHADADHRDASHSDAGADASVDAAMSPDATTSADAGGPTPCSVDAGVPCGTCGVVQLSAGGQHTCAVGSDQHAYCWGANGDGQLGDGANQPRSAPTRVLTLTDVVEVRAGTVHTCARLMNGEVWCWGDGGSGRLGNDAMSGSNRPVRVMNLPAAVSIAAGGAHSCAVAVDGRAFCWGSDNLGALGNGTPSGAVRTATVVEGVTDAIEVAAGPNHACARRSNGQIACWGANSRGQLGDGSTETRRAPVDVLAITDATEIAAGGANFTNSHTCARRASGTISCWGDNSSGQLGRDTSPENSSAQPGLVDILASASAVASGGLHNCAIQGGAVYCWGANGGGQLGIGRVGASMESPQVALHVAGASSVAAGAIGTVSITAHSCAATTIGLACWGHNGTGQLGHGTTMTSKPAAVAVCGF